MKPRNLFRRGSFILAVSMALGSLTAAHAEEAVEIKPVVVTATGYEQYIADAPASISVITKEDIAKEPAASVTDLLKRVEGVSITGSSPNDTDIVVRGMPGEYTLILVDGKRQNTRETMNRGTGGVQANMIPPLEAIERIEIVRGPMSAVYGSEAMGGVINIITKKVPDEWHGSLTLGTIQPKDGDIGTTFNRQFWIGGPIVKDKIGFQLYGQMNDRNEDDVYYPGSATSGSNGKEDENITAKFTITPNKNNEINVEGGYDTLTYTGTGGKSLADTASDTKTEHTRKHWSVSHDGKYGNASTSIALFQEIADQENWTNGVKSSTKPELTNTTLDAGLSYMFTKHSLRTGGQVAKAEIEGIGNQDSISGHPENTDDVSIDSYALYLEDEYFVTDKFAITAGVRMDDDERYGSNWTPRLYTVYKLTDRWTLRGGVAMGFKAPTIRQTTEGYCMTTGGGAQVAGTLCGNPDLDPEKSITEEAGIRYDAPGGISFGFTVYNNDIKDKVSSYATDTMDPLVPSRYLYEYENIDDVNLKGVEVSFSMPFTKTLDFKANYTYTDSERSGGEPAYDGSSLDGKPLDKTPEHMFNAQLDWQAAKPLLLYTRANVVSKQYWSAFRNGAMRSRVRPGTETFDIGGVYDVNKALSFKLAVLNIFDKKVSVDNRSRTGGLDGNWMVDEGLTVAADMTVRF
ncbi:TonB-dependent receptor [Seleniivibrio sp.]|uniref:TonB-dependent receptor domain-containing protein n=1 Tax=Seleniivibrio sp. TaxID=2898801 RepID=UPI0025F77D80|nr:TonB-dependent receptor [Seleniivibrio sp.]MCD8552680.1 TonB-dependent receptor [Seleniivibrio sp.]